MLGIRTIIITPELLMQIAEIDTFKGLWVGLEKHTSSLNLLNDVANHGDDFGQLLNALQAKPLTPDIIRALHATELKQKGKSAYKTTQAPLNIPQNGIVIGALETAQPVDIEPLLEKLCEWVNEELEKLRLHPLIIIAIFTAVFLQLSPFETGNLRLVRFLIMLLLLKSGYTYAPYETLTSVMDDAAHEILSAIVHNQHSLESGQPDWSHWLTCFMNLLKAQKDNLYVRLYSQETDLQNLPALSVKIMALFKDHERLQMHEIIKLTRGRRATIKLRLSELLEGGYLRRHGQARATWYALV